MAARSAPASSASAPSGSSDRLPLVDAVRGVAFVAMFAYHASWFADDHGLVNFDFASLPWRATQRCIAGTFFLLVGLSLKLAEHVPVRRFLLRLGRVLGCAAVVTATSVVLDPARVVTFGVLHAIFLASVLARPLLALGAAAALPGALLVLFASTFSDPRLDGRWASWTGLGTTVPPTFDHQPFVLWFGVTLLGVALGSMLPKGRGGLSPEPPAAREDGGRRLRRLSPPVSGLALLGRHSLLLYMAHVPLLEATMMSLAWLRSPG